MENGFDFKLNIDIMKSNFIQNKNQMLNKKLPKPFWISSDTLSKTYTEYEQLIETGDVFYAHLVQANTILFQAFPPLNCPADIIFSMEQYYNEYPEELNAVAYNLYCYKNESGAPEEIKGITDAITDEYERLYNIKLPLSLTNNKPVFFTTLMIYRKHLPKRKLIGSIFPVVTNPNHLQSAIILPKQYWTKDFIDYYKLRI